MSSIKFGDNKWSEDQWHALLQSLIDSQLLSWKEITTLCLGHMNPSQVGTSLASSEGFKKRYGKGNTMRVVMKWFYEQAGACVDCGTRFELQADHSKPRESYSDPLDADFIENMVLRCRRCNVIKRPSHLFGGNTHLTAESALMWILFTFKPRTLKDFIRFCRLYGMTMADIRMQEGWAMAHWLQHATDYSMDIDTLDTASSIFLWPDGAITRAWPSDQIDGAVELYNSIDSNYHFAFVASIPIENDRHRMTFFRIPISEIPFSHYFVGGEWPNQSLAISYSPPKRNSEENDKPSILPLPPRSMKLHAHKAFDSSSSIKLSFGTKLKQLETKKRVKIADLTSKEVEGLTVSIELV